MVIPARRNEDGLDAVGGLLLQSNSVAPETECGLDVLHPKMDATNVHARIGEFESRMGLRSRMAKRIWLSYGLRL
jgi:hypothetical protein